MAGFLLDDCLVVVLPSEGVNGIDLIEEGDRGEHDLVAVLAAQKERAAEPCDSAQALGESQPPPKRTTGTSGLQRPRPGGRLGGLEVACPVLTDEVVAEAVVTRFVDQFEPGGLVDAPGGSQYIIGPQRDMPVAGGAGEVNACVH